MFRGIELDYAVLQFWAGTGLSGIDGPVRGNGNDGFHLPAAGGRADSRERTARKRFSGRNALAGKLLLYQFSLLIQAVNTHLFIVVKAAVKHRVELQGAHGAPSYEGKLGQWSLVLFMQTLFHEPGIEHGITPAVRQGIGQERGESLVNLGLLDAGNGYGRALLGLGMGDGCYVVPAREIVRREPEQAGLGARIPLERSNVNAPEGDRQGLDIFTASCCHCVLLSAYWSGWNRGTPELRE